MMATAGRWAAAATTTLPPCIEIQQRPHCACCSGPVSSLCHAGSSKLRMQHQCLTLHTCARRHTLAHSTPQGRSESYLASTRQHPRHPRLLPQVLPALHHRHPRPPAPLAPHPCPHPTRATASPPRAYATLWTRSTTGTARRQGQAASASVGRVMATGYRSSSLPTGERRRITKHSCMSMLACCLVPRALWHMFSRLGRARSAAAISITR